MKGVNMAKYTKEFKEDAVKLLLSSGKSITEISQDLGIRHDLLSRWKIEYLEHNKQAFPGHGSPRITR